MISILFYFNNSWFAASLDRWFRWRTLYGGRVNLYIGRLVNGMALAVAFTSSIAFMVMASGAEEFAASKRYLPIPNGYCRLPDISSHIWLSLANAHARFNDYGAEVREIFSNCEGRGGKCNSRDGGVYFAITSPEILSKLDFAEILGDLDGTSRQIESRSPSDAVAEFLSSAQAEEAGGTTVLVWKDSSAYYIGGIARGETLRGERWARTTVYAYIAAPGETLVLMMSRPYKDESTIEDLLKTEIALVQRLLAPEPL